MEQNKAYEESLRADEAKVYAYINHNIPGSTCMWMSDVTCVLCMLLFFFLHYRSWRREIGMLFHMKQILVEITPIRHNLNMGWALYWFVCLSTVTTYSPGYCSQKLYSIMQAIAVIAVTFTAQWLIKVRINTCNSYCN